MGYVIGIDQSTQGTKAVLFDGKGSVIGRSDLAHEQIINQAGWVSHDLEEIYGNLIQVVKQVVQEAGIDKRELIAVGISNQRETTAVWDRDGKPLADAIVWQCARAKEVGEKHIAFSEAIYKKTGLPLSPYFPASKMSWLLTHKVDKRDCCMGTMDSWIIFKLTHGTHFKTDYSNASRTQLFNLHTLTWDEELCEMFGIPIENLAEVCDSNACFGYTDFEGFLNQSIPIHSVMGDSHAALFGQGCHKKGMTKTTYGTGSSIMMHIGEDFVQSTTGLATSLAWGIDGKVSYVLEGNINYTGAVITWLKKDMGLIDSVAEIEQQIDLAAEEDTAVLVPAFSGLSAPYWKADAKALLYGMSRTTGRAEIIRAATESIAYQITDVLCAVEKDSSIALQELRVDGGPTKNKYLMQFQSDMGEIKVCVPDREELSAIGVAYMAGIAVKCYDEASVFDHISYTQYSPKMVGEKRKTKYANWQQAVQMVMKA